MYRVACLLLTAALAAAAETGSAAAQALLDRGRAAEAEAAAQAWLDGHPGDQEARRVLLAARIARSQAELHDLGPGEQTAPEARLDRVRDLIAWQRYGEAVADCDALLRSHPQDRRVVGLKRRAQDGLLAGDRVRLEAEQRYRDGEAIADVLRDGTFPRDKPRARRQVFVFDEDMDELERQRVRNRLQEVVTLDFQGVAARPVIEKLFAVAGINYVILDKALGDQTLTLHLFDETVETALDAVAKLVKVRYSYVRGTVFITGEDDGQLVTEIIRLRSGLTDVDAQVTASALTSSGSGGPTVLPNGAQSNTQAVNPFGAANQAQNQAPKPAAGGAANGAGGAGKSDLERFIEKIPEIVVGWPSDGKIYLDRKSNTIYVRATPYAISEVKRLLTALDYNNVQVLIEARFVEVAEIALRQLGVSWQVADTIPAGSTTKVNSIAGNPVSPSGAAANGGLVFSGLTSAGKANILGSLAALEQEGKSHSLAEPKILTLNNSRGLIEVTREISYISGYTNQGTGSTPVTSGTTTTYINNTALVPQFAKDSDGISLAITPSVARNSDVITLRLEPKVKVMITPPTDVEFNMVGSNGEAVVNKISRPPEFTTRSLTTSLHIQNGQTVALGGLVNQTDSQITTGIPFLARIPVLGQLFRTDKADQDRRNLLILVTAHQVDPNGAKIGEDIERMRSTARVVLPEGEVRALDAAPLAPESLPASLPSSNPNRQSPGGRGGR